MDNLSVGKMNFTRSGKSFVAARLVPRQSAGISSQAAPSVLPANGPLAMRQSRPVNQASPTGDFSSGTSGKRGASELATQMRGTNLASIRNGYAPTLYAAASSREEKRSM